MTCEATRGLLSPYADGEVDAVHAAEIERHLAECPSCAAALEQARSLSRALGDGSFYYRAPLDLSRRVRAELRRAGARRRRTWRPLVAAAAAAVLAAVTLWGAVRAFSAPRTDDGLAREVVASHLRSLMLATHQVDVESSDQHTVKPWFIGKVDVAPEVKDLAPDFPLIGGRLDYIDDRPAAALVYRRNKHLINVFVWRTASKDRTPENLERQGYHLIHWVDHERTTWVVSDLNTKELQEFAELLRQ